jgi:hypothetical protein
MIVIKMPEYNAGGNISIKDLASSVLETSTRRVSRRATIDGGVYMDDLGFSHGDRTFEIKTKASKISSDRLHQLQRNYSIYECVTNEGIFFGAISSITTRDNILTLQFLVKNKAV